MTIEFLLMPVTSDEVSYFLEQLRNISTYDFTDYSEKSISRRIDKLVTDNNMSVKDLIKKMKKNESFLIKIVNDITVNTTELFRDTKVWHTIRYSILPEYKNKDEISIWHAGCSSGQEVYSMMILLNELDMLDKALIYGSDINADMIEKSRKGVYKYHFNVEYLENFNKVIRENPYNINDFNNVPYDKYMDINKSSDTITLHAFLREKPKFYVHDLVLDGNIFDRKFDIILCRNVLIYFNNNLQNKVFELFYNSIKENGYLIIGMHESILGYMSSKFIKKGLVYKKMTENI